MSSKKELKYLVACMREIQEGGIVVELGSYKGESAMALGHGIKKFNKKAKLFCVDTFAPLDIEPKTKGEKRFNKNLTNLNMRLIFEKNMAKYPHSTLQERTDEAYVRFENASIDFLYIDADHSYEAVKKDICFWLPKMSQDSIMCGHDYNIPDVKKAVDELFGIATKIENPLDKTWRAKLNY